MKLLPILAFEQVPQLRIVAPLKPHYIEDEIVGHVEKGRVGDKIIFYETLLFQVEQGHFQPKRTKKGPVSCDRQHA